MWPVVRDCEPVEPGEISVLAVQAPGAPGVVDVNCDAAEWYNPQLPEGDGLRKTTIRKFDGDFARLDKALTPNGVLYFLSYAALPELRRTS